jgi:hypothetical protein
MRVIAGEDKTLAVAALVWMFETGTKDDPNEYPGLVHALAIHTHQGNRVLAPGMLLDHVHNLGGWTATAVGIGQVRFESLLPASELQSTLELEALRLRGISIDQELWLESLQVAARESPLHSPVTPSHKAKVWRNPGMEHDGRHPARALLNIPGASLAQYASRFFSPTRATLIVVSPSAPIEALMTVAQVFSASPAAPREALNDPIPQASGQATLLYETTAKKSKVHRETWLWPLPTGVVGSASAWIVCPWLSRPFSDAKYPDQSAKCTVDGDPRSGVLRVDLRGEQANLALSERLSELIAPQDRNQALTASTLTAFPFRGFRNAANSWISTSRRAINSPLPHARSLAKVSENEWRTISEASSRAQQTMPGNHTADIALARFDVWSGETAIRGLATTNGVEEPQSWPQALSWLIPGRALRIVHGSPPTPSESTTQVAPEPSSVATTLRQEGGGQ